MISASPWKKSRELALRPTALGQRMGTCGDSRPRLSGGAKLRGALITISLCFLLSCISGRAQTSGTFVRPDLYAPLAKAPKKAVRRRNPLENDPDAVLAGGKLFDEHCAECHGDTAYGGKKGPSLRAPEVQQATPGTLFWLLTNGVVRRGMPVWSKLPEPERWQLVRYIQSLTPRSTPEAPPNPEPARPGAVDPGPVRKADPAHSGEAAASRTTCR
jgi:mono/diheme cytochrome c family protein